MYRLAYLDFLFLQTWIYSILATANASVLACYCKRRKKICANIFSSSNQCDWIKHLSMSICLLLRSLFIWKQVPPFRLKDKHGDDILNENSQDTNNWPAIEN
jgi:hypothetical protein